MICQLGLHRAHKGSESLLSAIGVVNQRVRQPAGEFAAPACVASKGGSPVALSPFTRYHRCRNGNAEVHAQRIWLGPALRRVPPPRTAESWACGGSRYYFR